MTKRPLAALAALALACTAAACSSNTGGHGTAGGPTPTDAPGLGARMLSAVRSVTSAHLGLTFDISGQSINGSGDEKVADGHLQAVDITESLPTGSVEVLSTHGRTYAKLPAAENGSGKPWVLVTTQSSNPVVAQLASSMDTALSAASVNSYTTFVKAAKSVTVKGHETVGGVGATHYAVVVDVSKVPASSGTNLQALEAAGIKTIPVELWIDDQGRPVKVTEHLAVQGQTVDVTVTVSKYNQPVTINPPPANQVSTN